MNRSELLQEAIKRWGNESQVMMAIEEMAELTKALSKAYRNFAEKEVFSVLEEIADVRIMMDQMVMIFEPLVNKDGRTWRVSLEEDAKLARLAHRMGLAYDLPATPGDCDGQNCHACANPCEKYIESLR